MRYAITLSLLLLLVAFAGAEIDVPETVKSPPTPIVATVDAAIPAGAQSKGKWEVDGSAEARLIEDGDDKVYIWAQPGTYILSYTGMWVDFEAKQFDFIDEEAEFKVTTEDSPDPPDPNPDPDPDPGPKQLMFFYHPDKLDNYSRGQRALFIGLSARDKLEKAGHVFLEAVDVRRLGELPERFDAWEKAVSDVDMPAVAWAPKEGGEIAHAATVPADYDGLLELLEGE